MGRGKGVERMDRWVDRQRKKKERRKKNIFF